MSFSHIDYFPFCIGEENPSTANSRYDSIIFDQTGCNGFGSIYPVGMTLRDAMALYWKSSGISWNLYQSISGQCFEFNEEGIPVPTGDNFLIEDYTTEYCPLKSSNGEEKPSSFLKRVCPEFEHFFIGAKTRVSDTCPPEDTTGWVNPRTETNSYYPMSCFHVPLILSESTSVPYRILKSGDLYYPSLSLNFSTYSRLYTTKYITCPDSGYDSSSYKTVNLIINENSYSIPLYSWLNYTTDNAEYDTQIGDEIYLNTWTA